MFHDTIAAIATASGIGGVAIIRMSGNQALTIASRIFRPVGKTPVAEFEPYRMYPGDIDCGSFSDFGMCVFFQAPKSYTGEDVVELHCHGGVNITRAVLRSCLHSGARLAERGEFTKRAFLNGKMSLSAAEGIGDMINGESEAEVKAGYLLYHEKLSKKVKALQDQFTGMLAGIDAAIDYPEEDIEEEKIGDIEKSLREAEAEEASLLSLYKTGKKIKSGVTVALCGKPNTGKSSLLNALLGYEKAIVSDIAGTTRDAVEGSIEIDGVRFHLYDTAGIREGADKIESIGITKAERIVRSADLVIFVCDVREVDEADAVVLESVKDKPLIRVMNKIDRDRDHIDSDADVYTSAVTGEGLERLKAKMKEMSVSSYAEDSAFLIEERHYAALERGHRLTVSALEKCGVMPLEILALDIKDAWDALGEITGETATEAIIGEIFSKFCVGK